MSINITYIGDTTKKVQKIKPVSSIQRVHYGSARNQDARSKHKDESSGFQELFDSKLEEGEKGFQKRK